MVSPFCARTKDYPRTTSRRHRTKFTRRERACYVKLARQGYSTNLIAKLFKRSTSVIHRILKNHILKDLRKIPRQTREKAARIQLNNLILKGQEWRDFSQGLIDEAPTEGKPP